MMRLKYCCGDLVNAVEDDFIQIDEQFIYIFDKQGRYFTELKYCPFCGKKIEFTEVE